MNFCKLASATAALLLSANANAITTGFFDGHFEGFSSDGTAIAPSPDFWPVSAMIDFNHSNNFENATGAGNLNFPVPFFGLPFTSHDTSWTPNYDGTISLSTLLDWSAISNEPFNLNMSISPVSCNSIGGDGDDDTCIFNIAGTDDNGDGIPGSLWDDSFGEAYFTLSGTLTMSSDADNVVNAEMFNPVPVPAAVWLFGSGLIGLVGMARYKKA